MAPERWIPLLLCFKGINAWMVEGTSATDEQAAGGWIPRQAMEGAAPESLRDSPRSQRAAESHSRSALV